MKSRDWPFAVALALATMAVFWPVASHEFVNYDDYAYVTMNPPVQQGLTWEGLLWAFKESLIGEASHGHPLWHPLTWLSHMVDCQLFGLNPVGHHLSNLGFHVLNTVLLFFLLRRLTGRRWPSALVAALFALHPLQVSSVAWVAERKNVLSTSFWMLTLLAYVAYAKRPVWWRYLLVFLLLALGLMAKPTLVTLPCVMLLLDFWPLQRYPTQNQPSGPDPLLTQSSKFEVQSSGSVLLVLEKVPFFALSAISCLLTLYGHEAVGALISTQQLPLPFRFANAVVAYVLYLWKLLWPVNLSVFYGHPGRWPAPVVAGCGLVLVGLTALALVQVRRRPYLFVGWLWFLGTLVPTIGLVQADVQSMADRFAYVPMIGVCVMVVWGAAQLGEGREWRQKFQIGLGGLVLAGCVIMTSWQVRFWQNGVTLLGRAVEVAQDSSVVHVMLGNAYFERTELDSALAQYHEALRLRPDDANAWQRAGVALAQQGKSAEAVECFQQASRFAPDSVEARRQLALAYLRQGRKQEARAIYAELERSAPHTAHGQTQLAEWLAEGGETAKAVQHYREALRLEPQSARALNNLAWLRATCPQAEWRDGREAVQLAEEACQLSRRRTPQFLGTLAAAYAQAGRFAEAMRTIQEALALAQASGNPQLVQVQAQMLRLFQSGKPFRQGAP